MTEYYLRSNVQFEPLFGSWYAWSHLIPPATASRNTTQRHLKIMSSYIEDSKAHAAAVKNPQLLGGPFMDYEQPRVDEIRELQARTRERCAALLELSQGIDELNGLLKQRATGFSMQSLYALIPEALRGYVELTYDLNNQPSFRLLESLLYKSRFFLKTEQSLALSIIKTDERPFVLSTPRLPSSDTLYLTFPFDDLRLDQIFKLKTDSRPLSDIKELFDGEQDNPLLLSLVTEQGPARCEKYSGSGVRWRYFGHACILVETPDVTMLFDPVISYNYPAAIRRYTYDDLPDWIDFVLITHNHQDHVLFETILQIRHKVGQFIVPKSRGGSLQDPSLKLILEHIGCHNVVEVGELDEFDIKGGSITCLPSFGEHADLDIQTKAAYLVRKGRHSLLFAADSCAFDPYLYKHIHSFTGNVDVLFLGMECDGAPLSWIYGPLLTQKVDRQMDQSRRLAGSDYEQAKVLVDAFSPRDVYVYAMGQEPWLNYVMSVKYTELSRPIVESNKLIQECIRRGITAERLFGEKEILVAC